MILITPLCFYLNQINKICHLFINLFDYFPQYIFLNLWANFFSIDTSHAYQFCFYNISHQLSLIIRIKIFCLISALWCACKMFAALHKILREKKIWNLWKNGRISGEKQKFFEVTKKKGICQKMENSHPSCLDYQLIFAL